MSDNNNFICIIGPCLKMGGMERSSVNLANSISDLGYNTLYIALFKHEHFFTLRDNICFCEPPDFNINNLSFLKTMFWLRAVIKKYNPQTILVFNKFYSALVLVALTGTKFPVYISERSSPLFRWGLKLSFLNYLIYAFWKPTGIIAQTTIASNYQKKYYGSNIPIKVIPNALRTVNLFPEIRRKKTILAVGRFNDELKGFDRLLESFARVNAPDWHLVFAGGDEEEGHELKQLGTSLGIIEKIIFLGKVRELDPVFAKASIFVIPSRSEGFPNALCEAMAAGLACIAFDFIAGPRDLITDQVNGLIIEEGNILALAAAMQRLIDDESIRLNLGRNAMCIKSNLNGEIIAKSVISFIKK